MVARILVIHGAGIELRGKVDVATFGPMTMEDYNTQIARFASTLEIEVQIFHSLDVQEVVAKLASTKVGGMDGVIINPAGFTIGNPVVSRALGETGLPTVELHFSNPAKRGVVSEVAPFTTSVIAGFGIQGYFLGLLGLRDAILAMRD